MSKPGKNHRLDYVEFNVRDIPDPARFMPRRSAGHLRTTVQTTASSA
jgi:hypothetical protein